MVTTNIIAFNSFMQKNRLYLEINLLIFFELISNDESQVRYLDLMLLLYK